MRKTLILLLCVLLCVCCLRIPALAEENTLTIATPEEFLAFAENCRLDSYSKDLTVRLTNDIDLIGMDFQGIPIFYGSFEGDGHTVSGVNITVQGSHTGFFRYVAQGAVISKLNISGTIAPTGSAAYTGGIAGSNEGQLLQCSFSGTVSGTDHIGGIAGINATTGIIEDCSIAATVYGDHFVGGIAGTNQGVIRSCVSKGGINTTESQNKVDISDITLGALTGTESSVTVTDIGGIAGTSTGVIRSCENRAQVGYPHIGYNIGGIAGSQMGFLTDCINNGAVHGRKDVGGIVGQLEPNTTLIFQEDTLQILKGQLDTLSALTDKASTNANNSTDKLSGLLDLLDSQVEDAQNAADQLVPKEDTLPDPDSILAAGNALGSSLTQIGATISNISTQAESSTQSLTADLKAIENQLNVIQATLENGEANINSDITDISDLDTLEDVTGKVSSCINNAAVQGDRNIGGIAGTMGFETDLDPEVDLDILGQASLNHACDIRAVIRDCRNTAAVSGKKQNTGGLVGAMILGLVRDCTVTGNVTAGGDYVGGITGSATGGFVRSCYVKAVITGGSYVGGIAGTAPVVSDCRSMTRLIGNEAIGGILGQAEDRTQITGNYYLAVGKDPGGVDGISYTGCAQPLTRDGFLALENLPAFFQTNSVTFRLTDGTEIKLTVPQGSSPAADEIPTLPLQDGAEGMWVGKDGAVLENITFDSIFEAVYNLLPTTLESTVSREDGMPVFLVQGSFPAGSAVSAQTLIKENCLEAWQLSLPEGASQLRYRLPADYDAKDMLLQVQTSDGQWHDTAFTVQGSYLVFAVQADTVALQLVEKPADYTLPAILIAGIAVIAISLTAGILVRKKKKK